MSRRRETNFGQEITLNEWQIGFQNLTRLTLLSMTSGVAAALLWFGLFAPANSFTAVNLYWYSWLYCRLPFGCSNTALYNQQVLKPTIDKLGNLLGTCMTIFAFASVGSGVGLRYYFTKRGQSLTEEQYLRGAKLLEPDALKAEIDRNYPELAIDLKLGQEEIRIPESLTFKHISLSGASGSGKTQAINSLLKQLRAASNQKVLVIDLNGQFYSRFGQPGDKILSLYDKRTEAWEFWQENAPPEFFAEALVEELKNGDGFFVPAGRALLTDLIKLNSSISGLWQDLTSKVGKLLAKLEGGISPSLLGAEEQAAGVQATASLQLGFLQYINHWSQDKEPFSITQWATSLGSDWVFLIVRDQDLSACKPLLRLWFDLATLGVLQREENADYPHLWLIGDELPGLGKLPSLGKLLSQGRKYKATVLVGYQAAGQINNLYGQDGAKEIFQGLQTKIVFRNIDPDTAKQGSLELGEQEVEEVNSSTQLGVSPLSDRNSLNRGIKTRPIVMPSELQRLPDLHAYVKICQFDPTLVHFIYQNYPVINQPTCCEIPTDIPTKPEPPATDVPPVELEDEEIDSEPEQSPTSLQQNSNNPNGGYDFDPEEENSDEFLDF